MTGEAIALIYHIGHVKRFASECSAVFVSRHSRGTSFDMIWRSTCAVAFRERVVRRMRKLCSDWGPNPRRACAARVTFCLCVIQNLTYRPTNDTTYLTGNEGHKICAVFSENAPLQS